VVLADGSVLALDDEEDSPIVELAEDSPVTVSAARVLATAEGRT
jgi:hypothetical protein